MNETITEVETEEYLLLPPLVSRRLAAAFLGVSPRTLKRRFLDTGLLEKQPELFPRRGLGYERWFITLGSLQRVIGRKLRQEDFDQAEELLDRTRVRDRIRKRRREMGIAPNGR